MVTYRLISDPLLFPQMRLDSPEALGVLNTLFESVAPSSLRPVDMLLKSMFTTPTTMVWPFPLLPRAGLGDPCERFLVAELSPLLQASVSTVQLWVSGILAVLRVLISQSTEDIVLSRIHELSLSPHLLCCNTVHRLHQHSPSANDLPAAEVLDDQEVNGEAKVLPEETFARLVHLLARDVMQLFFADYFNP